MKKIILICVLFIQIIGIIFCYNPTEMILVKGGVFTRKLLNYKPNKVTIDDFYIGKYEVTIQQYRKYLEEEYSDSELLNDEYFIKKGTFPWDTYDRGISIFPDMAISEVNFYDAIKYCNWLSKKENLTPAYIIQEENVIWNSNANGYRLPTEAEWQYAATADWKDENILSDDPVILSEYGYLYDSLYIDSAGEEILIARRVGQKKENIWGLCDVIGNTSEWCWDLFDIDYYSYNEVLNPRGPEKGNNPNSDFMQKDIHRVCLGASITWDKDKYGNPIKQRMASHPDRKAGFRVARNIALLNISAVLNDSNVRVRDKSDLNSTVLIKLNKGDKVQVIEQGKKEEIDSMEASWYKVVLENKTEGWVYGYYLDFGDERD
jgi:formylglycine-generating enzyme required for sulfatase activity